VLYSVQACKDEYLAKFPNLDVEEQSLMTHIRRIVDRFAKLEMFRRESRRLNLVKILLKI
jgi:hypothetical protein